MKKKVLVGLLALLLIGAVIGGLIWFKKKSKPTAENPGGVGTKLTDAAGNVIEMTSEAHPEYGYQLLVNGVPNGHLVTLYLRPDGVIEGVNKPGGRYAYQNNGWVNIG